MDHNRQTTLTVYGDGPFEPDLGRTTGCEDVAVLKLLPGFAVVRTEYLGKLEKMREALSDMVSGYEGLADPGDRNYEAWQVAAELTGYGT